MKDLFRKIFIKITLILLMFVSCTEFVIPATCGAYYKPQYNKHIHNEMSYQKAWCEQHGGILEYQNNDMTRVDCLTETHAIEFDFANKWAESVGQALYYQHKTGKRGMVILILEYPDKQLVYYKRVKALAKAHDFDVDYVTQDILNLDEDGCCQYKECKCHKKYNKHG
ncbi:MAG: hypothetical protein NC200_03895 [Candidatus Gastranaerophilales bacterium]|nr:hypothetical protein [Candidatus Gastranaerophilales bacterium]